MRDFKTSEYKKVVGVTENHFIFIDTVRGKKSKAGKLKEIIEFYKIKNNL